jgi:hypothetical protein
MKYFLTGILKTTLFSLFTLAVFVGFMRMVSYTTDDNPWVMVSFFLFALLILFLLVKILQKESISWADIFTWQTLLKTFFAILFMAYTLFGLAVFGSGHSITSDFLWGYIPFYLVFFLLLSVGLRPRIPYKGPDDE